MAWQQGPLRLVSSSTNSFLTYFSVGRLHKKHQTTPSSTKMFGILRQFPLFVHWINEKYIKYLFRRAIFYIFLVIKIIFYAKIEINQMQLMACQRKNIRHILFVYAISIDKRKEWKYFGEIPKINGIFILSKDRKSIFSLFFNICDFWERFELIFIVLIF